MFISPKDNKTTTIDIETVNDNEHKALTATPEYNDKEIVVSYEDVENHHSEQYDKQTSVQLEGDTSDRGHVVGLNENTRYKNGLDLNQEYTEQIHIEQDSLIKTSKLDIQTSILHRYITLFQDPRMCIFFISQLLFFSGFLIPFIYVPDKAKGHGELM